MSVAQTTAPRVCARLRIQDWMRIEGEIEIVPDGNHLEITGPNGAGKTCMMKALAAACGLETRKDHPEPVHNGAPAASVTVELKNQVTGEVDVVIELEATADKDKLIVRAADRSKISNTRELLDAFGDNMADLSFLRLSKDRQVAEVLKICGVEPPVADVSAIVGEEVPALEGETAAQYLDRQCSEKTGALYFRRRDLGKRLKAKQDALTDRRRALSGDQGAETESMADLLKAVEAKTADRDGYQQAQAKAKEVVTTLNLAEQRLGGLRTELNDVNDEVKRLEDRLAAAKAKGLELAGRIAK